VSTAAGAEPGNFLAAGTVGSVIIGNFEGSRNMDFREAVRSVEGALGSSGDASSRHQAALEAVARLFAASTATLHRADGESRTLHLLAWLGIPEKLLPITREIPFGKGMAGLCALRLEPVTVCNLQTDASGAARPGARETGAAGAVVVPVLEPGSGRLLGTLGIGKPAEHSYTGQELEVLHGCAGVISQSL
jgi:signal transduction protein with GAF and PtsI domain